MSSTAIRRALQAGDVEQATALLGRPHEVRGTVAHGDKRGRELGFPTANVAVPGDILLPADGIYAGWFAPGRRHRCCPPPSRSAAGPRSTKRPTPACSRPTCSTSTATCTTSGWPCSFVARLRGEEKFDSVDALVDQMERDVAAARSALA